VIWDEVDFQPRVDRLTQVASDFDTILSVRHPERFRPRDVIRLGGSENAWVISVGEVGLIVQRGYRSWPVRHEAGDRVLILASGTIG